VTCVNSYALRFFISTKSKCMNVFVFSCVTLIMIIVIVILVCTASVMFLLLK